MDALEIRSLNKSYGSFQLRDIDLTLPAGCIMGLIGENGAGKSTTINLILDLISPDSGEIRVLGNDNRAWSPAEKEQIGVVLDDACFPETLSAGNVGSVLKRIYRNWEPQTFEKLLRRFELPSDKVIKDYSRGMKMKLSIAVALSHRAKLLILDEATSGLDPVVRDEILDLFLEFIQEEDHSIFISSHITNDLEKICDYIAFLHQGQLLFCEEKDRLHEKYGILKCSAEELAALPAAAIKGRRSSAFGVEALVLREQIAGNHVIDPAGIEDIMVYTIRKEAKGEWEV